MAERKPLIGVTGYDVSGEEGFGGKLRGNPGQGFSVIGHDYLKCVESVGGIPVGLPVLNEENVSVVTALDGIIFTGGEDIAPHLYGENVDHRFGRICPDRDYFELRLLEAALKAGKPILGICRGLQLINVHFGGTLYKDVSDKGNALVHNFEKIPRWYTAHKASLLHPVLRQLYGSTEIEVNSFHHMSANQIGDGLEVAAVAPDGIVEALIHKESNRIMAVQWHPEMMAVQNEAGLIPFCWLVDLAKG
jgi:putative glutamine amidotransferase